jgi:hypothetical protein
MKRRISHLPETSQDFALIGDFFNECPDALSNVLVFVGLQEISSLLLTCQSFYRFIALQEDGCSHWFISCLENTCLKKPSGVYKLYNFPRYPRLTQCFLKHIFTTESFLNGYLDVDVESRDRKIKILKEILTMQIIVGLSSFLPQFVQMIPRKEEEREWNLYLLDDNLRVRKEKEYTLLNIILNNPHTIMYYFPKTFFSRPRFVNHCLYTFNQAF